MSRPRKQPIVEGEDSPTYVLEGSNESISNSEYENRLLGGRPLTTKGITTESDDKSQSPSARIKEDTETLDERTFVGEDTKVGFGTSMKRKIGKVLGSNHEQDPFEVDSKFKKSRTIQRRPTKVKLSFNDEYS